jgi:Uma2 family endonuclease
MSMDMTTSASISRPFEPGTTGWSVADLADPQIEREWERGAYEIVEGVLTRMPAAYFEHGETLLNLVGILKQHLRVHHPGWRSSSEVEVVISPERVARVDAVLLSPEDVGRQRAANAAAGIKKRELGRILIVPTLIIEAISVGHEGHDRRTKRRWYAERQAPNYWILDPYQRTLECLILEGNEYRTDQSGRDKDELRPAMFPGLVIPMAKLWVD